MTLQQLRCFIAVAQNMNFRQAAKQLYISQPAVTHQIQSLETELGIPLFQRTQHHIQLTEAGSSLYSDAVDILDRVELARKRAQQAAFAGPTLHVGCESSIQIYRLPQIYQTYRQLCPNVAISNTEVAHNERRILLMNGQLDVAFMAHTNQPVPAGLSYDTLFRGYFCCVVPVGHRLADKHSVTVQDLEGEVLILIDTAHCPPEMDSIQKHLRKECRRVTLHFSGSSVYTIPMIEGGLGIAVMPNFVCPASDHIRVIPFETDIPIEYGIVWHTNDHSDKTYRFIQAAREAYRTSRADRTSKRTNHKDESSVHMS